MSCTTGYTCVSGACVSGQSWWNASWPYRTKLLIENSAGSKLNNTLVLVNFSTSSNISQGKMRSDCGDVRFTDNWSNELGYTLETSTCNTAGTLFWVWTNLNANANTTIYAYYGNSTATLKTDYTNPDKDLVLYMHLDNDTAYGESSSKFFDFSKKANNGTCTSCPTRNTGRFGWAYLFDGLNNYIDLGRPSVLNITGKPNLTESAWVNSRGLQQYDGILDNSEGGGAGQGRFAFQIGSSGRLRVTIGDVDDFKSAAQSISLNNTWYYVAITLNSSDSSLKFYINGVQSGSTATFTQNLILSTASWKIGRSYNDGAYSWNGTIDEVRIYTRTLGADEISAIYNKTRVLY
jgi:hypothetical protein